MTSPTPAAQRHPDADRVFYRWRLVAVVALLGLFVGNGLSGALAWDLFDHALNRFALGRQWWSLIAALNGVLSLPVLLLAGWAVDRYGPRRMAQIGLPLAGVGLLLMAADRWGEALLFIGAVVVELGTQFGYTLTASAVLNNWFRRRKATAMAIPIFAASGLWRWPLRPLLTWMIGTFGWTLTATGIGLIALFAVIPLSRQIRNRPEEYGQYPDGGTAATAAGELTPDYTWREAVKSRQFWRLLLAGACLLAAADAAFQTLFALQIAGRIAVDDATPLFTMLLVLSAISILPGGLLGDRIPVRYALLGFGLAPAVGVLALYTNSAAGTVAFFILAGVGNGGRVAPALAVYGVYFGRRNYATLLAIALTANQLAAALGSTAIGVLMDAAGGGAVIAVAAIVALTAIGAVLYWQVGPPALAAGQVAGK